MSPKTKHRYGTLSIGVLLATIGLLEALMARRAQLDHAVLYYKGSWFSPEVGYLVAIGFLAMAAFLIVAAFRKSNNRKP